MNSCSRKRLLLAVLLLSIAGGSVRAQWRMVAPNLTQVTLSQGAMSFHDGIVWVATTSLFMSTDTGKTWTSKSLPVASNNSFDIEFNSATDGVFTSAIGTWSTSDAGSNWREL